MKHLATLLSLALVALPAPALASSGLAGTYQVQGWNPGVAIGGKASYAGTLTLQDAGKGLVATWETGQPAGPTHGLAILSTVGGKRLLSIGYNDGQTGGIAVYQVSADGKTLIGVWGPGAAGHETARRTAAERQI